ncbi:MAG TPA: EAL domain-containing protein [Thermoanaerobaculia bacterium]|nr:EAL domain-containing protein [Thermoanaerobaculia bacterium]
MTLAGLPWTIPLALALSALAFAAISLWALTASRRSARRPDDEELRAIVEGSPDLIARHSENGVFCFVSSAAESVFGFKGEELVGRSLLDLVVPDDRRAVREYLETVCRGSFPWPFTYRLTRKDGGIAWIETNASCRGVGSAREVISYSRDVTERKRVEDHIAYLAYHDELTGLPNRTLFNDRLTIALAQARRFGRRVALLFLDLDYFKRINDTLGHRVGDQLLEAVSTRLRDSIRLTDTVARLGGDEFTVLLSEVAHEEDTARIARKILDALSQRFTLEGHHVFVSASMGIAVFPNDGDEPELLLKNADSAMYRAKNSGRNTYSFCTPETNARFHERLTLENDLRRAFEREEFIVYYQPVISARSGKAVEMEALIRWNDPARGVVSPAQFLPVAEDSHLLLAIGEWVLRSACRQAKEWSEQGNPVRIGVNLSARQFHAPDLRKVVERALGDSALDPSALTLEVAEEIAARDLRFAREAVAGLRDLGVRVDLDDFGAGTSSFGGLKELAINGVKIDSRFPADPGRNRDAAILSSLIAAARALDLRVIGKSVESAAQYDFLRQNQCDEMQGFLFGAPMPPGAASRSLRIDH